MFVNLGKSVLLKETNLVVFDAEKLKNLGEYTLALREEGRMGAMFVIDRVY
jgi:hypothetical protein